MIKNIIKLIKVKQEIKAYNQNLGVYNFELVGGKIRPLSNDYLKQHKINYIVGLTKLNYKNINKVLYIGFWKNKNKCYYDMITFIKDKQEAIKIGKAFNQQCIYDLKNDKEIFIK